MDGMFGTFWGRRETYAGLWLGNLKERDHLKFLVLDERIIFRWILKIGRKVVECNSLTPQVGDKWRALVNKIVNIQIS
jgi:hypothetical protein